MLLIVDEVQQCVYSRRENTAAKPIEFLREIFDAAKCGLVICATPVFGDEMETGRFAGILRQCKLRRLCRLMLPAIPTAADLDTFAAAYGLPPAAGDSLRMQTDVIREEALGIWLTLLRMAAKLAKRSGRPMGWEHVRRAHLGLKSLESVK
jgi:hypothetical protein